MGRIANRNKKPLFIQDENLIISVNEARKLLGSTSNDLTDSQVRDIILTLSLIAKKNLLVTSSNISLGV